MPRKRLASYGRRRFRVNVFVARGLVCCEWRVRGRRKRKSWPDSAKTREVAKRWAEDYADERRRLELDKVTVAAEPVTLSVLWSRYRLAQGESWRPKTRKLYDGWWKDVSAFFGPSLRADALTLDRVDEFRQARRVAGVAHGTIRRTIGFLRQLYNFGEGRELVPRNRLRAYRYVVAKDERGTEPDEYTRDEIVAIAKALDWPEQWRPRNVIRICGTHGKRVNAVLHLQWADVDFERRCVTWRAVWDKTGTERVTPMTKVSHAALFDCHRQRHPTAPWVFWSSYRPTQPLHYNGLHWHLQLAEARAGVPHKPKRAFHGLRRFVVNELGDLQLAGWWVGQSSLRVTAGYERERIERLNEARERLDRKEVAAETATDVATGISKSLPRQVGARGFEPPTSWSRTRRANRTALRPALPDVETSRSLDP